VARSAARHRSSASPLALAYAALVLYASLFPFADWRWPAGQGLGTLLALPWPPWRDPFDGWVNLLGYLPLGALLMIAARRSGWSLLPSLLLAVGGPALLSAGAEVLQNFLPRRHPSLKDLAMNTAGAAIGALLALAAQALGLVDRWGSLRQRWFAERSALPLALLALWPLGLMVPAAVPLGLGPVAEPLRLALLELLADVPWASAAHALLADVPLPQPLRPLAEASLTVLGLLAPCLLVYSVVRPGWQRIVLALGAAAVALAALTLSTLLSYGPQHALAWVTPLALPSLALGLGLAMAMAPLPMRVCAGLGLVTLTALILLVAQAPADPYFAINLASWELGRWVRFYGLAQWIAWLWPFVALLWLLSRVGARDG
jgi:VanZ family protein